MRTLLLVSLIAISGTAFAASPNQAALERMARADTNHDGNISKAELLAFRSANFQRFDRDGSGALTRSDVPAFFARLNPDLDFDALLNQFDANHDRQVSRNEFVNGPTIVFDAADTNHDGLLTSAERNAAMAAARR
jgi:Ca2+-binding EF-hand superfamily protein